MPSGVTCTLSPAFNYASIDERISVSGFTQFRAVQSDYLRDDRWDLNAEI